MLYIHTKEDHHLIWINISSIKRPKNKKNILYNMKTIKLGEDDFQMSETWDELSLEQLINYQKIVLENEDGSAVSDLILTTRIFEILCNQKVESFSDYKLTEILSYVEAFEYFLSTKPTYNKPGTFTIGHTTYSFISLDDISMGEMASIDFIQRKHPDLIEQIPYIIAICCRPVLPNGKIDKFNTESLEDRKSILLKHKALDTFAFANFFLSGGMRPTKNIQKHSD